MYVNSMHTWVLCKNESKRTTYQLCRLPKVLKWQFESKIAVNSRIWIRPITSISDKNESGIRHLRNEVNSKEQTNNILSGPSQFTLDQMKALNLQVKHMAGTKRKSYTWKRTKKKNEEEINRCLFVGCIFKN